MAAVVLTAIGFVLLEGFLQNTGGRILATIGATAYLFGGILLVAAEALSLTLGYEKLYGLIVTYVVMAFLAQAAIGGALLQVGVVAAWIGWGTILWNTACLIVLSIIARRDLYFPILHHFAPLVIGLALLGGES
jgi:CHASE2 domain-containing sensor protein